MKVKIDIPFLPNGIIIETENEILVGVGGEIDERLLPKTRREMELHD